MAVKIALAVGLFIVICVIPGLKSSQVVPDGLVYTEAKRTLVQGVQGVLTCRFFGDPSAVYWRKRLNPDELSLMVLWLDGEVSGPRYDDGSCDVDENYSLIINNVSTADSGRMYCTVSNNKGPLMNNYTDILVVDNALTTNPQVTIQMRQATYGILQCTVHIKARRVSWKKGTTSSANESLIVMESNNNVSERSGAGYYDGTYNITQDYSLIINELQVHHEGLYVCEVTDDTGISFRNHTFVNVVAQPLEPFPIIQECLNGEQHNLYHCTLVAESRMTLTCQAVKYYPSINLVFLYGSRTLEPSDTREWNNTDGTKNKTITIATRGNKELYTCMASSIPGTNANKSTSVLIQGDEPVQSTMVVLLVCFPLMILLSVVGFCIWRKRQRMTGKTFSVSYKALVSGIASLQDLQHEAQMDLEAFEQLVNEVLMQRYRRISDFSDKKCTTTANEILTEIRAALCDTHQMLIDWRESQTSTRIKEMIEIKTEPAYAWPSDEELNTISRNLTPDSMKKVCKKLKIDFQCDDANDEGKRFKTLRKWRTKASAKPLEDKWKQLFSALESNQLGGLLPTLRGPYIYKAELVDLAFHLLIHDLLPITKELGIDATKLVSYRPAFHPSHLESSTINLLIEIYASIRDTSLTKPERLTFCKKIANSKYDSDAITGVFEYNMSYGELCSISEAINTNLEGSADQEATSGMLQSPGIFESLQNVLQLTDQDIAHRLDAAHPLTTFALLKIWKEKPRPSVFNYRAAVARELRRTQMPGLADEVAAGKYMVEGTSLAFIEDMVRGLHQDQLECLGNILKLSGTDHWSTNTPSDMIFDWVARWTNEMETCRKSRARQPVKIDETTVPGASVLGDVIATKMLLDHRDLNDELVEHGFLDLAREIMIIEQRSVTGLLT